MKNSFFKKLTALLLGTIMVLSMIPAIAISTKAADEVSGTKISGIDELTTGEYIIVSTANYVLQSYDSGWILVSALNNGDTVTTNASYVWTIEVVSNGSVKIKDSAGIYIKPKSGNTNGIQTGSYNWAVTETDGNFVFKGTGSDTTTLACNKQSSYKVRSYKNTTASDATKYPSTFVLYKVGAGDEGTDCTHTYTDCADEICDLCEEARTAPGHIYDNCEDTECNNCTTGARDALEHVYTNDYDASCNNCTAGVRTVNLPATGSTLDIPTALLIGAAQDGNTAEKYYIEGVVTSIYNTTYGNMYIEDADGNEICVYGSYDAVGKNRYDTMANPHKVGDTVRVYGALSAYKGNGQMVNGWVTILPKYEGFGLTLNKGITIRVKLTIDQLWIDANPDAKVMFTDALGTQLDPIAGTNYYSITLTPGEISRNIKVTYCNIAEDVRVETYIAKAREQYADDEALMLLLDAITAYGQAANGENAPAPDFTGVDAPTYDDDINLFGGNLTIDAVLDDYANIGITVVPAENLSYTISLADKYAAKGDDFAAIVTDGKLVIENLRPANFDDEIVLTVTDAEGKTATATVTFNGYLKALYDLGNEYQNMAAATYNYGVAVEAYVAATAAQQ